MSTITTAHVSCDFCHEAIDDGDHGHRTKKEARELFKRHHGRRILVDGHWKDICESCYDELPQRGDS